MEHFLNKKVRYIGENSPKSSLVKGQTYDVSHLYGNNIGVVIGETPIGIKFASASHKLFEIVGVKDSPVQVYSVLLLDGQPVGVRFREGESFYDVEASALTGVTTKHLMGYKTQSLLPHGDYLVTEEELTHKIAIKDMSENRQFSKLAISLLTNK